MPIINKCYSCDVELLNENSSIEHIIPRALGGKLKSSKLLCKNCNERYGYSIDAEIEKQLGTFAIVIGANRKKNKIELIDKDGEIGYFGKNMLTLPILDLKDSKTGEKKRISFNNYEERDKFVEEFKIGRESKGKTVEINVSDLAYESPLFFKNNISNKPGEFQFGGDLANRAIVKMLIGYYIKEFAIKHNVAKAIDFIDSKLDHGVQVRFHYIPILTYTPSENEISHVIMIKGVEERGLVYGYVELFNCFNFLVILNNDYDGKSFKKAYRNSLVKDFNSGPIDIDIPIDFTISGSVNYNQILMNNRINRLKNLIVNLKKD